MNLEIYKIRFTNKFAKNIKKLNKQERKLVYKKIQILSANPFHPSLRTKKVKGLVNIFELSVNMDIRILWEYNNDIIIILLDVGHHSILD